MNRKGFTLIELLIVVFFFFNDTATTEIYTLSLHDALPISSMKSDLRNLVTAEEAYFADSIKYSPATACTNPATPGKVQFCTTTGNTLGAVTTGSGTQAGWTSSVTNINTTKSCGIYVGAGTPSAPATTADPEGAPVCR